MIKFSDGIVINCRSNSSTDNPKEKTAMPESEQL